MVPACQPISEVPVICTPALAAGVDPQHKIDRVSSGRSACPVFILDRGPLRQLRCRWIRVRRRSPALLGLLMASSLLDIRAVYRARRFDSGVENRSIFGIWSTAATVQVEFVDNPCRESMSNCCEYQEFSTVLSAIGTRSLGLSIAHPLAPQREAVARQLWADKIASSGHFPSEFRVVVVLLIEPHHSAGCTGDPSDMFRLLRFRDRGRTPCARSITSWGMPICRASSMSVRGVM